MRVALKNEMMGALLFHCLFQGDGGSNLGYTETAEWIRNLEEGIFIRGIKDRN